MLRAAPGGDASIPGAPPLTLLRLATLLLLGLSLSAQAQDRGSVNPKPLPPLANPDAPDTPAKALFGRATTPAPGPAEAYGSYAKGCFSGARRWPSTGRTGR